MNELGIVTERQETDFKMQNIVCTATLDKNINLNALSIGLEWNLPSMSRNNS